ncbi:MAG TPA: LarC family nickel insertion protein, partial [Acidimicrobiales bacterium]|nr:LarC family nickel insertion protein [Acidimicrobiales bacterium]
MATVAWFNCFSGIAGDMTLGALVDAGADLPALVRLLEQLPIGGWSLEFEPAMRGGLACTRAVVTSRGDSVVRTWLHIQGVLEEARLPDEVRDRAHAAFEALARSEGRIHRRRPEQVHFHEVGGHDTIVDIVGSAAALYLLGVDAVGSSPVATGIGVVRTAHGILPNPAPAVVDLLNGIPTVGRD